MGDLSIKKLWVLMVTAFVDMVGFALVLPLLPLYARDFGATASTIGYLMAAFALAQLLTAPHWGRLSDRIGRRPVILGGQALSAVAFVLFGFADSVWVLLFSRLAQGVGGGTIAVTQAYVSDAVRPEDRAQALGWISACTSAGVMLGPAIGSLSLAWTGSEAAPGLIAAGFCVLNMIFAWHWLPESTTGQSRDSAKERPPLGPSIAAVVTQASRPAHALIWVYASGMLAFMGVASITALFLSEKFAIQKEHIGYFYVLIGFCSVLMRGFFLGIFLRRFKERGTLRLGTLALFLGLAAAPFAEHLVPFVIAMLGMPIGTALLFPATTSLISAHAEPGEAGQIHGVQQAFGGTSRFLGPIWAGYAYQAYPPAEGVAFGGGGPFWVGAVLVSVTLILALRLK